MAITTLQENLDFCGIDQDIFSITAGNDVILAKYDAGSSTSVEMTDGTYTGTELAAHLKTLIDTAFTISSTVSYSTTTRFFTIAVTASHTIQVISSGSDGALTLGFSTDSSAAVSITSDSVCGSDPTAIISTIKAGAEAWIKKYCNRNLEASTSYSERYNGTGTNILVLNHYPVISLTKLAIGTQDVIRIRNTNTGTTASVSVTTTGISLERNGTTNSTVTFASYSTLSTVVTAINLISGWEALIQSSDYNSYISTDLIPVYGLNAIDNNWVYLGITDDAEDEFTVDTDRGIINLSYEFPLGYKNIYVKYVAYGSIDESLKLATLMLVKYLYQKRQEESSGMKSYRIGDVSASFNSIGMPVECKLIFDKFKRMKI